MAIKRQKKIMRRKEKRYFEERFDKIWNKRIQGINYFETQSS